MFHCVHLEIWNLFLTKGAAFLFFTGSCKSCSQSCLSVYYLAPKSAQLSTFPILDSLSLSDLTSLTSRSSALSGAAYQLRVSSSLRVTLPAITNKRAYHEPGTGLNEARVRQCATYVPVLGTTQNKSHSLSLQGLK